MKSDRQSTVGLRDEVTALRLRVAALEAQLAADQHITAALQQSEARFASLFRASPVAVVISTLADGRYLDVNQRFCDLTGYTREEVIGRTSLELGVWVQREDRARIGQLLATQPLLRDMQLSFRAKDGSCRTMLAAFALIQLDQQPCVLTVCQDITEREQLAAERDRLYAQAQAALSAREEFLSITAHELKTPITSLSGYAQLLLRRLARDQVIDPSVFQHGLQAIHHQAQQLTQLVNQMLDVSRIDAGRLVLRCEPTELRPLLEHVISSMQLLSERHLLRATLPPALSAVVDPLRIEQVLTNLLDNAIKYSPAGGAIDVALWQPSPGCVAISVTDQGPGIAPEHQQRIFERFYRANRSDGGGMGLGLHISRQIVELHGGQLTVESPSGGGSRFVVTLPADGPPDASAALL